MPTCDNFLKADASLWTATYDCAFLREVKSGEIPQQYFDAWLTQDHMFVLSLVRLAGSVLASAPTTDLKTLLAVLVVLEHELHWFQAKAKQRGFALGTKPQPAAESFIDFIGTLHQQPYAVKAAAFWAIEQAYCKAWASARPVAPVYEEFAERWAGSAFQQYCEQLKRQADRALAHASQDEYDAAARACHEVAQHEVRFWDMV
jgi:thiaminase/transcriptional activator TenA